MKFEQSFEQAVFDRFYKSIGNALIYFGIASIFSYVYQSKIGSQILVLVVLLFPIVFTLWLYVFNRGQGRVDTFSITIN